MSRTFADSSRAGLALCLALMVPAFAAANQPYGYPMQAGPYPYYYPQQPQQYPQQYPRQYPGTRKAVPQQAPWYPYQQPQPDYYRPPRVEVSLSDLSPYEQQSLVLTVRVVGQGNLKTVTPQPPSSASVVLRALGEPVSETAEAAGSKEVVTRYHYLLMPLSSGTINLEPVRVSGRYSAPGGGEGPSFEAASAPLSIEVRPAVASVQPWLPLYRLQIDARLQGEQNPVAGSPIQLEVETRATGATGAQIPSVADQLDSSKWRIYPGTSITEGRVSDDGGTLLGRRVERFTLVPRYGGWLSLPAVKLNWWNVRYNQPEVAALLADRVHVAGPPDPARGGVFAGDGPVKSPLFWLPLGLAVVVLVYGWVNALFGEGRLPGMARLTALVKPALGELYAPLSALAGRLSPRRSFHRLRTWTGRKLPVSWKLWFCLRALGREDDPAQWGQALQILSAKHLGVRPQAHLRYLGEHIARYHPKADAEKVDRLMRELDAMIYGGERTKPFRRWKREFESQIKPSPIPVRLRRGRSRRSARVPQRLPALNPR